MSYKVLYISQTERDVSESEFISDSLSDYRTQQIEQRQIESVPVPQIKDTLERERVIPVRQEIVKRF